MAHFMSVRPFAGRPGGAAPLVRSEIEALRGRLSQDECRILASLPACWLETAAKEREMAAFPAALRALRRPDFPADAAAREDAAAAASVESARRMHASAVASARAARLAATRFGVARLPG